MLRTFGLAISFTWAARVASAIVNLILLPLVYKNVGPERFALFLVLNGLFGWVAIGNLGLSAVASRIVAANGGVFDAKVRAQLGRALILPWLILTAGLIISLIFTFSRTFATSIVHSADSQAVQEARVCALVFCTSLYVTNVGAFCDGIAIVMNSIAKYNAFRLGGYLLTLLLLFSISLSGASLWLFALLAVGIPALATLLLLAYTEARFDIFRSMGFKTIRWSDLFTHWRLYLLFFITTLSFYVITQFSWTLVGIIHDPQAAVGLAICFRLLTFMDSFTWSANGIIWPWIVSYLASGQAEKARRLVVQSSAWAASYSIVASLMFFLLGSMIIAVWIGGKDMLSLDLKAIFSAYIVVYSLSRFSGALLLSFKDESVICFGYVTEGILALAIGGALTVKYGQSGMAFGILAGSLLTVGWIFPMRVVRSLRARTLER